jgi:hypothetical protein
MRAQSRSRRSFEFMPLEAASLGGAAKAAFRRTIFTIDREPDT